MLSDVFYWLAGQRLPAVMRTMQFEDAVTGAHTERQTLGTVRLVDGSQQTVCHVPPKVTETKWAATRQIHLEARRIDFKYGPRYEIWQIEKLTPGFNANSSLKRSRVAKTMRQDEAVAYLQGAEKELAAIARVRKDARRTRSHVSQFAPSTPS